MKKIYKFLTLGLILSSLALVSFKYEDRYFEIAKNLDIFATLFKELNALYVDEINPNKAMRTSIEAMLKELDPYTNFYPEDDIEDYRTLATGKYNGIGATVSTVYDEHTVVMIYEDSPADKAGIKIGDVITNVNGVNLNGRDSEALGRLLKGQTGSEVDLMIARYGQSKPLKLSVKRAVVKTPNVPHYGMVNTTVGYIQLSDFSATAAAEIKSAFEEMKEDGMKELIIDLRSNPGGLLNMAIDICNFFVPKGELIVETKGKVGQWNKKYTARFNALDLDMPVAVLINSASASASEIVSGTLQDYDRGVIIGQRSFGKGLVQTTRPLSFNTQLKVTTAKYYIPSGRCIQALDYSHRNEDGSVGKVPDSLKSTFYTKNGRPVLDGGGVDPDIYLAPKALSVLTKQLIREGVIFDFATEYYFKNEKNIPVDKFITTTALYDYFLSFVKKSGFKYYNDAEDALAELELLASKDVAYEGLRSTLLPIRSQLDKKNITDYQAYKEEIKDELALEILSRYHYDKAMKFVSFEKDQEVQEALKLFADKDRYRKILKGK
jgi:carboxyl-terminal processing protease